ncbi:MAG: CDP-alcohol phosphatidyltransferase family protein [Bacteroidota bacterium]
MKPYRYEASIKSRRSDEIINTYLIRPIAGKIVRLLYTTSVTPNHLTIAAIVAGLLAAGCYGFRTYTGTILAAILIEAKDILDSADGQLARAKQMYSRRGRFLDSLGDVVVNATLFSGLIINLHGGFTVIVLAITGFMGMTLRVSYHVFYHVKYLHLEEQYIINRTDEKISEADRRADPIALFLQKMYLVIYGWQDRLMAGIDRWCLGRKNLTTFSPHDEVMIRWYRNTVALRLSGFLGLGTELALLACCSILGNLSLYLLLNTIVMNIFFIFTILYRKFILSRRISV